MTAATTVISRGEFWDGAMAKTVALRSASVNYSAIQMFTTKAAGALPVKNQRGPEKQSRPPTHVANTKTQRHQGHPSTHPHKEADAEPAMRSRLLAAERQATGSPVTGEKRANSECERSSSQRFSLADVPEARRFCRTLNSFCVCRLDHYME